MERWERTGKVSLVGGSLASAACFGAVAVSLRSKANAVEHAPCVSPKEAAAKHMHSFVCVRGSVEPVRHCVSSRVGKLPSVAVETVIERTSLLKHGTSASSQSSAHPAMKAPREAAVISHDEQYVDWYIQGDGPEGGKAVIESTEGAARAAMDEVTMYRSESTSGLRMFEKSLPCGARVSAIGVATPPETSRTSYDVLITGGGPFFSLSRHSPIEIGSSLRTLSRLLVGLAIVSGSVGGSVLLLSAVRAWISRHRRKKRLQEIEKLRNDDGYQPGRCCVCLVNELNVVFRCGHLCICSLCLERVDRCPICRHTATGALQVFYP